MRSLPLFLILPFAGCAAPVTVAPSLAPRAAEAIDPRVPVSEPDVPSEASPALVQELKAFIDQALAGDRAFRPAADRAAQLAAAAGPARSESWVVAQQALSAAVSARAPVTFALGEIDSLASERVERLGGIAPADLAAINAAAARVAEIDRREAAEIERIESLLRS